MSKTVELARHLETLHINNMYKSDFYWTWDKTDDEIDAIFTVADALRDLRERNKSTKIFNSGLGISLFRDNSTRTRFSFASACNLLGLEEQVLDEKKSQIAHGETVRETANMVSFMADVIGIRDDMYIHQGHEYQKTFMDALEDGYQLFWEKKIQPLFLAHRVESEARMRYYFAYAKSGFVTILRMWLEGGCRESPRELAGIIHKMLPTR